MQGSFACLPREGLERMLAYPAIWLFLILFSVSTATGGPAPPVQRVRFGTHGELSRVVIDLRENTPYAIGATTDPTKIRVEFPSLTRLPSTTVWRARDGLVREVEFVAEATNVVAEIRLGRSGRVHQHAVLKSPARLVLDMAAQASETPQSTATAAVPPSAGQDRQTSAGQAHTAAVNGPASLENTTRSGTSQAQTGVIAQATRQERKKRPGATKEQQPTDAASGATPFIAPPPPAGTQSAAVPPSLAGAQAFTPSALPASTRSPQPPVLPQGVGQQFEALKAPEATPPAPALSSAELLGLAEYQWKQGQLDKARLSYTLFLERFPGYPTNHFIAVRLADIFRAKQDYRTALESYAKVMTTYPGTEGAFISQMHMAELGVQMPGLLPDKGFPRYFSYHHPLEALNAFIQNYPAHPLVDVACFKIGTLLLTRQESLAALDVFQQLLAKPLKPELRQEVQDKVREALQSIIAEQQRSGRDMEVLRTFFTHKELLAPTAAAHPDFLLPVAVSYARLGLLPEAQSLFQSLLPLAATPAQRAEFGGELLRILLQQGLFNEAKEVLRTVETALPAETRGQFLFALGKLAWQGGQAATAMQYLRQGQNLLPTPSERSELLSLLGAISLVQGKETDGLQALQHCVEVATVAGQPPLPQAETCLPEAG
jgi:tetratricopeptide (TPR) repeat protein